MVKRLFDLFFTFFLLIGAFPFLFLCALCVKLSSPGPLFYSHMRVGRNGKPFGCLKFRTMVLDADRKLEPLLAANPVLMQEWKTYFKLKVDPRITWIGRFLRKTSLDELPQILNVLKGEMSVVGPRPMTEHEIQHYAKEKAATILSLRPGLTTLWIVQGRNRFSLDERIAMEEFYVKNRSLSMDLKIIILTAFRMLFPNSAY